MRAVFVYLVLLLWPAQGALARPLFEQKLEFRGQQTVAQEIIDLPPRSGPASDQLRDTRLTPGHAYAYVLEGAVLVATCESRAVRISAGENWDEHNQCFAVANASCTRPAKILMTYIVPRGAPLTAPLDRAPRRRPNSRP